MIPKYRHGVGILGGAARIPARCRYIGRTAERDTSLREVLQAPIELPAGTSRQISGGLEVEVRGEVRGEEKAHVNGGGSRLVEYDVRFTIC